METGNLGPPQLDKSLDALDELMNISADSMNPSTMDLDEILASTSQLINPAPPAPPPKLNSMPIVVSTAAAISPIPPAIDSPLVSTVATAQAALTSSTAMPTLALRKVMQSISTTTTSTTLASTISSAVTATNKHIMTPASGQHIVLLQKPGGAVQQIRISGASGAQMSSGNIQFIKTSDGNYLQIKNNSKAHPSGVVPPTSINQTPTTSGIITTTGNGSSTTTTIKNGTGGQRIVLSNTSTLKVATSSTTGAAIKLGTTSAASTSSGATTVTGVPTGTPRTMTVAEAQKLGLLSSAKIQELVSKATAQKRAKAQALSAANTNGLPITSAASSSALPSTSASAPLSFAPTLRPVSKPIITRVVHPATTSVDSALLSTTSGTSSAAAPSSTTSVSVQQHKKILIQTADGLQKEVTLPPQLYKLAKEGRIKAISIAGQADQYVRVNRPDASKAVVGDLATMASTSTKLAHRNGDDGTKQSMGNQIRLTGPKINTVTSQTSSLRIRPLVMYPPPSTATSSEAAAGTVLNRSFKMRETINPDMLIRRNSLSTDESGKTTTMYFGTARRSIVNAEVASLDMSQDLNSTTNATSETEDGPRRKHCNCTKSQCLKLYCDCFANGEFCQNCNCKDCFNNLENQDERQKAIKMCLERNPRAFKPKIGKSKDTTQAERRHTKGCNCKRSSCLKNYCECYEAKIACSENCKCIDCHNQDDYLSRSAHHDRSFGENSSIGHSHNHSLNASMSQLNASGMEFEKSSHAFVSPSSVKRSTRSESPEIPPKKPCNFMTGDVIDATIQCLVAQAEECQKNNTDSKMSELMILEEFGRCLVEIVEFSRTNPEN